MFCDVIMSKPLILNLFAIVYFACVTVGEFLLHLPTTEFNKKSIYKNDKRLIDRCDGCICLFLH